MTPNPSLEPTHTGVALGALPGPVRSIILPAGQAPHRRSRLSSNVNARRHNQPMWLSNALKWIPA